MLLVPTQPGNETVGRNYFTILFSLLFSPLTIPPISAFIIHGKMGWGTLIFSLQLVGSISSALSLLCHQFSFFFILWVDSPVEFQSVMQQPKAQRVLWETKSGCQGMVVPSRNN